MSLPHRIAVVAAAVLGAVAVTSGVLAAGAADPPPPPPSIDPGGLAEPAPPAGDDLAVASPAPPAASRGTDPAAPITTLARSVPQRLRVPAIGVDTALEQLGQLPDGSLDTPEDVDKAGWFAGGVSPGELGPAVIDGHVTHGGRARVFYRLAELSTGSEILVDRADGTTAVFRVDRIEQHPKDAFPTVAVYGNTTEPQLRLVTCGGEVDEATGHFRDNVVAFATLSSTVPTA